VTQLSLNRTPIAGPSESKNVKRGTSQPKSRRPAKTNSHITRRRLLMEGLETRYLMAGASGTSPITGVGLTDNVQPRNVGAVGITAFRATESELSTGRGINDAVQTAQFLPLGTGAGKQHTIDVTGFLALQQTGSGLTGTLPEDIDFYSFDLRAGDILDITGLGSIGSFDVFYSSGQRWFAADDNQAFFYPANSPLMTVGNVTGAQIVPETGRYFLRLASNGLGTSYTAGLRVYRPNLEQAPLGTKQKIFLQFEGDTLPSSVFLPGTTGTVRVPALRDSFAYPNVNILIPGAEDALIDKIVADIRSRFSTIVTNGTNGDFASTGVAGQFGYELLNSRDNPTFVPDRYTTRVFVGGTSVDYGVTALGVSETLDIGNFRTDETVIVPLDLFGAPANFGAFTPAGGFSFLDLAGRVLGGIITHEVGHSMGLRHTNAGNLIASIVDTGGSLVSFNDLIGAGGNLIVGDSILDVVSAFPDRDLFQETAPATSFFGSQRVAASMSWGLATGKVGQALTGTVYSDTNQDGRLTSGEAGLSGITVFADFNGNGVLDAGETATTSGSNGSYSLALAPSTVRIVAMPPSNFSSASQTVTVGTTGASNVNLGLARVSADITGTVFADLDGNGARDAGEPGTSGVFVYLDLDGDNRIDIGEPRGTTDANGNYTINFPGPGTYIIREVLPSGFEQTFPLIPQSSITLPAGQSPDEHRIVFNGSSLTNNFNFGNRPNLDFGDAPNSYKTTLAAGGPSHGILPGLSLGLAPDREIDGRPSANADGDDVVGVIGATGTIVDDEDGIVVLTPIGPGAIATFQATINNTTGQTGYLQAWFDFNKNGSFTDGGEQVLVNSTSTGVTAFNVAIPSSVTPGPLYARFRYSLTRDLGVGGQAATGEVEDYVFTVNASSKLANDDTFTLTRNSQANVLNVLDNDFETANSQLHITSINTSGIRATRGVVIIAAGQRSILYTPPVGFTGTDSFTYTVTSTSGQSATATVNLNVSFVSQNPIAVDDSFEVAQGGSNIALNVLDNDVPSPFGGVTIISVTPGSQGGSTRLDGGNQAVRYTPRAGFNGTEEFTYSISDTAGNVSSATVTVNLLPGSRADDLVDFSIRFFDAINTDRAVTDVQVGQEFLARVFVNDLRGNFDNAGVFSAFLDLLYSDELVAAIPSINDPKFAFNIDFGDSFSLDTSSGDANTPGLFNELGSVRTIISNNGQTANEGPIELLTIKMQAISPGIAVFKGNPADAPQSETTLFNRQTLVSVAQQRFGISELTISPSGTSFTSAIDDSFRIQTGNSTRLDVISNDILGPTGIVSEVVIVRAPGFGNLTFNNDFSINYTSNGGSSDFDSFSYALVTADGVRSIADVSLALANADANDDLNISLTIVDGIIDGVNNPITGPVPVGSRFGVQIMVDDLRSALQASPLGVFAAFADILYDAKFARPANTPAGDTRFNFDVVFGNDFGDGNNGGFGIANVPGIIDELGSFITTGNATTPRDPNVLATLYFDAIARGTFNIKTNPADSLPQRESLFFQPASPIPVERIRFGSVSVTIGGGEGEALQNPVNAADVNNDGLVTPLDALTVINQLSRTVRGEGESASTIRRFTDVTGDGLVTPLDALTVINVIARQNRVAPLTTPDIVPTAVPSLAEGMLQDDSEEEDVFDLLARDISSVWQ